MVIPVCETSLKFASNDHIIHDEYQKGQKESSFLFLAGEEYPKMEVLSFFKILCIRLFLVDLK